MKLHLPLILAVVLIAGCSISPEAAKRYTSEIRTRASAIKADAQRLHPTTQEMDIVQNISDNADAQIVATDAADALLEKSARQQDKVQSKLDKLSGSIGVKVETLAWIGLYSAGGLWLIMRIVVPTLNPGSKFAKIATETLPLMNGAVQKVESVAAKLVTGDFGSTYSGSIVNK